MRLGGNISALCDITEVHCLILQGSWQQREAIIVIDSGALGLMDVNISSNAKTGNNVSELFKICSSSQSTAVAVPPAVAFQQQNHVIYFPQFPATMMINRFTTTSFHFRRNVSIWNQRNISKNLSKFLEMSSVCKASSAVIGVGLRSILQSVRECVCVGAGAGVILDTWTRFSFAQGLSHDWEKQEVCDVTSWGNT